MPTLKERLTALLSRDNATEAELRDELETLKTDQLLDDLHGSGHLPADDETRQIAREFAKANPDGLARLLRAQKPTPAQTTTYTPPTAPRDETEDAIQTYIKETGVTYDQAALAIVTDLHIPEA